MSLNNSRNSYGDCFILLDQALEADRGIRIEVPSINDATYLRMRLHHARTIDRRENRTTYPETDHPLHGRSIYDIFVIRIEPSIEARAWVYLDKQKVEIGRVEPIPDDYQIHREPIAQLTHSMKLVEGPRVDQRQGVRRR